MAKNLSKFVFKQLVYDYLNGDLEGDELTKFEEKVKAEGDCFDYVELTKKSIKYMDDLSRLEVSETEVSDLNNYKNDGLFYLYNPFSFEIPVWLKVGFPVLSLLLVSALVVYVLPVKDLINKLSFSYKQQPTVVIAPELEETLIKPSVNVKDVKIENQAPQAVNSFKTSQANSPQINNEVKNKISQTVKVEDEAVVNSDEFVSVINDYSTLQAKNNSEVITIKNDVKPKLKENKIKKRSGPQGTLYRVYMSVSNLDSKVPQVVELIERMGGEKAGQKELGYLKPKGRGFHFKLPANNLELLFAALKDFGRVRIDKERHWRKMQDGESRAILWVEDLDLKAERSNSR